MDVFEIGVVVLFVAVGIPFLWVFYVDFGGNLIGDLIEQPPWSRTVRGIQIALAPVVLFLAWQLNFKQFAYGMTAIIGAMWAFMWARTLLRGETWLWQRGGRFNAEWAGPIVLAGLALGYMSSAISPWF